MEQRSDAWTAWRKQGLGGSDAPTVMGVSPYKTRFELWEDKAGIFTPPDSTNWAMERGNNLEAVARVTLEMELDLDLPAALFVHPCFAFMRASLDGWNAEKKIVAEIKCPGREEHEGALAGLVPAKYYPQVQHQLFVTGSSQAVYASYYEGRIAPVWVARDLTYQKQLFAACCDFWTLVQKKEPPELCDQDFKLVREVRVKDILFEWSRRRLSTEAALERIGPVKHRRWRNGVFRIWDGKIFEGDLSRADVHAILFAR